MDWRQQASRQRFTKYLGYVRAGRHGKGGPEGAAGIEARGLKPHQVQGPEHRPLRQLKRDHHRRQRGFLALLGHLIGFMRGQRAGAAASVGLLTLAVVVGLVPPYGIKLVIDGVLQGQPLDPPLSGWIDPAQSPRLLLAGVAVTMVTLSLVSVFIALWSRWRMTRLSKRMTVLVRRAVFNQAVRLPLHRVYELKSGGVASILREDAGAVGEMVFSVLYNPWRAIVQLAGSLAILAWIDWRLLVGAVAVFPVVYLTHRTWIRRIRPMWRDIRATRQHVDSHATEAFGGIRIVRGFGRQRTESGQFVRNNDLMARQELYAWWWMRGVDVAWQVIIPVATAALLWYGAGRILSDRALVGAGRLDPASALTVGDLTMFIAYLGMLLGPIATLAGTATQLQNNLAGLDRVLDLLDEQPEMPDAHGARDLAPQRVAGRVTLQGVSFTYPGTTEPVLRGVNLEAAPGQVVALVGPSGAGKTTLCNLVCRFYDPTAGRILLDGELYERYRLESFRRLLGIVEQDVFLFDGTVRDNIAYGRRGASDAEVTAAAKRANAHGFITDLPQGYDTLIGERGVKLSGGQRQRLSIARAILADPRLLVLDEATSNLDTESEQLIQAALADLFRDRTTFVIAHRLSTITHADQIVVLDHGEVVEAGTHAELMEKRGRYFDMVERQRQFGELTQPA